MYDSVKMLGLLCRLMHNISEVILSMAGITEKQCFIFEHKNNVMFFLPLPCMYVCRF